jgi:hypothetical protein
VKLPRLPRKTKIRNPKQVQMNKTQMTKTIWRERSQRVAAFDVSPRTTFDSFPFLDFENCFGFRISDFGFCRAILDFGFSNSRKKNKS